VLQNEKYIAYADENTVEVISIGEAEKGINDPKDLHGGTYDAKDENGNPVKYVREFAGMTIEQLNALAGAPEAQFNKTGGVPYVCLVDPWTQKEITRIRAVSLGGIQKAVEEARAQLVKEHGPWVKRSTLKKVREDVKSIDASLALPKGGLVKALTDLRKLQAAIAKEADSVRAETKAVVEKVDEAAKVQLDDAEAKIAAGDVKGAKDVLGPIASLLRGTDFEARVKELQDKLKAASAPATK
jgi:hypothetical protein